MKMVGQFLMKNNKQGQTDNAPTSGEAIKRVWY